MGFRKLYTAAIATLSLAGSVGANILWDPVGNTCKDFAQAVGQPSLDDAVAKIWGDIENMAKYALDRMNSAASLQGSDPWEYMRVIATYDTFFDIQHPDSQQRWDAVRAALDAMQSVSSTQYVYMMCDDAYMYSDRSDGHTIWNTPHDQSQFLDQGTSQVTCAKANTGGSNLIAYRQGWNVRNAQFPSYVVMCAMHNSGDIFLDQIKVQSGESLDQYTTLTTTLFHEFLHVLVPSMRGDSAGGNAPGGERYQVVGTQSVRSDYSPENPDSITLFALSLAVDNYFWMTTKAETKQEVWNRFQNNGQEGQNIIQAMGLTSP